MSSLDLFAELLEQHKGVNSTAAWPGAPKGSQTIKRVCSCGEVIGQLPYPVAKPGRRSYFRLSGDPFDKPHRDHIAEVLAKLVDGE